MTVFPLLHSPHFLPPVIARVVDAPPPVLAKKLFHHPFHHFVESRPRFVPPPVACMPPSPRPSFVHLWQLFFSLFSYQCTTPSCLSVVVAFFFFSLYGQTNLNNKHISLSRQPIFFFSFHILFQININGETHVSQPSHYALSLHAVCNTLSFVRARFSPFHASCAPSGCPFLYYICEETYTELVASAGQLNHRKLLNACMNDFAVGSILAIHPHLWFNIREKLYMGGQLARRKSTRRCYVRDLLRHRRAAVRPHEPEQQACIWSA